MDKWRAKYGAIVIAFSCLLSLISSWGKNWILTGVLGLGVFLCGAIGFFDIGVPGRILNRNCRERNE
ncbi:hypothetical protein LIS77_03610 [Cytobacillus firmus]|uniref:hypothetical protein n=1 Tax=Cytobacillus firmus TaxID=1399 RepID=UPI00207AFCF6|nr:hypothetical protein [Cytobacillus firmus]USK39629.1 hypothetical protein LIS77_03610 [Cytobacillus firmus]